MYGTIKRVILVGIDGMQLPQVKRFVKEGSLPNFKRLMENGSCGELMPVFPAWTPTNWGAIATGAYPGATFLGGWFRRSLDDLKGQWDLSTFSSRACPVETIWEAGERVGVRSLCIFYPLTWPPKLKESMVVAPLYSGPGIQPLGISRGRFWSSVGDPGRDGIKVDITKEETRYLADVQIAPSQTGVAREFNYGDKPEDAREQVEAGTPVHLTLAFDPARSQVVIRTADGKRLTSAERGAWSEWVRLDFGVRGEGSTRFYLYSCAPDDDKGFALMHSGIYPTEGFTSPVHLAEGIVAHCGPFLENPAAPPGVDEELDRLRIGEHRYQGLWMAEVARYLQGVEGWDLYYQHFHILDAASHPFLAGADPASAIYDPETGPYYVDLIRRAYQAADEVMGRFMELGDDGTVVMTLSDHGNVPNRWVADYGRRLEETGLLVRRNGEIIWEQTKAFMLPQRIFDIYINLEKRYPKGIVRPEEYEGVQEEIIDALLDWRNPDGKRVVAFALKKADAQMVGYWGEEAGDVVFVFNAGHGRGRLPEGRSSGVASGGANHGPQMPTTRTDFSSNLAAVVIGGPGIKRGYERDYEHDGLWQLVDVVPTISYMMGFRPPYGSRGAVMYDLFE